MASEQFIEDGGNHDDWEDPSKVDANAAIAAGTKPAERALSADPSEREAAFQEITDLGLQPFDLSSDAYPAGSGPVPRHDEKLPELERRRRDVKADYDALVKVLPIEAEVIRE